jgi:hypothetical protein
MVDGMTALHTLLRLLLVRASGVSDLNFFRPYGQRAPVGDAAAPYATVRLMTSDEVSANLRQWVVTDPAVAGVVDPEEDHDLVEVLESFDEITVSVQFWKDGRVDAVGRGSWGEAAHSRAASLVRRLWMTHSVEYANQLGLGFVSASQVRDLSAVVDAFNERRAQVDLTFYVTNAETFVLNTFASAAFDVKIQQPDNRIEEVTT